MRNKFYIFGTFLYAYRYLVLIFFAVLVGIAIPYVPHAISQFSTTGFTDPTSQSAMASSFLDNKLLYQHNRFIVVYESKTSFTKRPALFTEIKNSLEPLNNFYIRNQIIYPDSNTQQISKDKHTAYAVVILKGKKDLSEERLKEFIAQIKKPPNLTMLIGGQQILMSDTKQQTQKDLIKAEYVATPVAVITLLLVFGSLAAALVPMVLDGICAVFIIALLYFLGQLLTLSVFTFNIALLLGLCLSLDYALFIISRFRDEIAQTNDIKQALAITMSTAGQAVFFSGLAVLISLSALLLFPINILMSVGVGGMTAVAVAVLVSIIVLPAILAILRQRINFLSIPFINNRGAQHPNRFWNWLVKNVVKRPWTFLICILLILIFLGSPLLSIKLGISDYRTLPKSLPSRQVFDLFEQKFSETQLSPIYVIATAKNGKILSTKSISSLYNFTQTLSKNKSVERIDSIVTTKPQLQKQQYQQLYIQGKPTWSKELKQLMTLTTKPNFTTITIISKFPADSKETKKLIEDIRAKKLSGLELQVTGTSATSIDVLHKIAHVFPYALLWVIVLTYLSLLILLRSIFLPIKAIIVNMLSLFASYGVLVFIIQEGHFARFLNFDPLGFVDISLMIIIFCALFGFSMDYEVFLLSRIKERYEQTSNNVQSIIYGIVNSSKIITSAAIVVILICFSFLIADTLMVKAFGLGIAIAIFIDAFLIRTLLVPALMTILGRWNWYLPHWLNRLLPKLTFNPKAKPTKKTS